MNGEDVGATERGTLVLGFPAREAGGSALGDGPFQRPSSQLHQVGGVGVSSDTRPGVPVLLALGDGVVEPSVSLRSGTVPADSEGADTSASVA